MAISAVGHSRIGAYLALTRVVPAPLDEVGSAAAAMPTDEALRRPPTPGPEPPPSPYVNGRGETTGTLINTTA
jgi:hypothetical protein